MTQAADTPPAGNSPEQSRAIVAALDRRKIDENLRTGLGSRGGVDPEDRSYWPQVGGVPQRPGAAPYGDVT